MVQAEPGHPRVSQPARIAYGVMLATLVLMGWLHMATPLLSALFSYLALVKLQFFKRPHKLLTVAMFLVLLAGIAYGLGYVINQTIRALPEIADKAIPSVIDFAKQHQIELPFTDFDSLKDLAFDTVKSQVHFLGSFAKVARGATTQFVFLAVGCLVAIGLFLNPTMELDRKPGSAPDNWYSLCCDHIAARFRIFYESFATVMGAQILISAINTALTGLFVIALQLPYVLVVIGMTFLCGLLPVIGNVISNTIVVGIGFTVSPQTALIALVFLVVVHKLEYLLNSRIVGHRIRNPFWLTLLALVLGERLMGVPGMILAPVVLNYIKLEASRFKLSQAH
jgi:predicted PurR-regulated permease PerM